MKINLNVCNIYYIYVHREYNSNGIQHEQNDYVLRVLELKNN